MVHTPKAGCIAEHLLDVGDCDLHLDSRFDADASDLLHNLGGRVQVDQALVDAHLEAIPSVGTLTARRLASGDAQRLGGQADWPFHLEALVLGTLDKVSTDCAHEESVTKNIRRHGLLPPI